MPSCYKFIYFCSCAIDVINHELSIWLMYLFRDYYVACAFLYVIVTVVVYLSYYSRFFDVARPCALNIRYIQLVMVVMQESAAIICNRLQTHTMIVFVVVLEAHQLLYIIILTSILSYLTYILILDHFPYSNSHLTK